VKCISSSGKWLRICSRKVLEILGLKEEFNNSKREVISANRTGSKNAAIKIDGLQKLIT
jgi:hypothetical protein